MRASLIAGHTVLAAGGRALDAVTAAAVALEDDPHFNAGHGAVLTEEGRAEMDAAIMDGADRAAGAIACVCGPRNPILGARAVMQRSAHVLLAGDAAERFLRAQGIAFAPATYFLTERRVAALTDELSRRATGGPDLRDDADRHGTVGAVARDRAGHLAAATSTGGMTGKQPGRVGDTPVFGAGTWADDATCAVSATGHGEYFVRWVVAHEIASRMRYLGEDVETAASSVVCDARRARRVRRPDRGRCGGADRAAVQQRGHVPRRDRTRRRAARRDLRRGVVVAGTDRAGGPGVATGGGAP